MSVVLVLEPDGAQAEQLMRVLRKRVRAEAILVTSPEAAIEVIANATPDLILVSALLSPRDEDRLMAHLRSLEDAAHLQTLTIPRFAVTGEVGAVERNAIGRFRKKKAEATALSGCDPDVFAQEISAHLTRALEIRSRPVRKKRRVPPPETVPEQPVVEDPESDVARDPGQDPSSVRLQPDCDPIALLTDAVDQPVELQAEQPQAVFLQEAVAPTEHPDDLLQRLARRFGFGSERSKVAGAEAPPGLPAPATLQPAADTTVIDAAQRRAAEVTAAEAEARLTAERHAADLAVAEAEARLAAERHAADVAVAEAEARLAAGRRAAEVAAVETEARLAAERHAAEVAAAEAEARLAAELERVRAEGEARRLTELARLQAEAEVVRDAAIVEARAAAEREAREALASELTRVRSEAEGVFNADLARVRAEVEEKLSAQVEAAETRLVQAEQARSVAEAAAAPALAAEVARVRGEAETRLQSELERIRAEAEAARRAELSMAKHATQQIRDAAAREAAEARASAEAAAQRTLEAEMARVRAQADSFLQTEIARVRADAQERQAAELQELRAQMAEIRDTAARTAAEQSADYYKIWQSASGAADDAGSEPAPDTVDTPVEIAPALAGRPFPWVKWAVPAAACMLLIANIGSPAKPTRPPAHVAEPVDKAFVEEKTKGSLKVTSTPAGAHLLVDGRNYGDTPVMIPALDPGVHTLVLRSGAGSITRKITIRAGQTAVASEAIFSGWLAIYSAVPMEVSLNGKPAAAASDGRIMTPPGSYDVTLVNERFNYHGTKTLNVRPGEVTAYTVSLPSAAVRIVAPDGADITVDGKSAGKAPLDDVSLPLGTHEITAVLPDGGGQRSATIGVRDGDVTEARLEF